MRNKSIQRLLSKTNMFLLAPIVLIVSVMFSGAGVAVVHASNETRATANPKTDLDMGFQPSVRPRVVEIRTIQYIEKPVVEVKYIEKVRSVPIELHDFNTLDELKQWLDDMNTRTTTIYFERLDTTVDCDDFALTLQRQALKDGYVMSFQIIEPNTYNRLFKGVKLPPNTLHAINLVLIGNDAYYIEPQTGEIALAAQRD